VAWNALIEVESNDFNDFMQVPLINVSRSGALLNAPKIYMYDVHLFEASQNNELNLIIHTPVSELDSRILVRHYGWNEDSQGFNIGVEFKDLSEKNLNYIDEILKDIRHYYVIEPCSDDSSSFLESFFS
jgi:hypothetical protein